MKFVCRVATVRRSGFEAPRMTKRHDWQDRWDRGENGMRNTTDMVWNLARSVSKSPTDWTGPEGAFFQV